MAYVLLRSAAVTGDRRWLEAAANWADGVDPDDSGAFIGEGPAFPDERAAISASVCFGEAGVWWCRALVAAARDDADGLDRHLARFVGLADACPMERADVVTGAAGLLLAAAALVEQLAPSSPGPLLASGERLAARLTRIAGAGARIPPTDLGWLGAAHGWAGIAYALLRWSRATGTEPGPEVRGLLDTLRAARLPSGLWPRHTSGDEVWPGWCHGSAGWVQLWTLVHDVLGDPEALGLAEQAADHALAAADDADADPGPGLCCGQAGIGYAALALFRSTGEARWLDEARRLASRAEGAMVTLGPAFPQDSLWQGDLGVALLVLELDDPSSAAMPLVGFSRPTAG